MARLPEIRRCTECGDPLAPNSKHSKLTCSPRCRAARSRRKAREKKEGRRGMAWAAHTHEQAQIAELGEGRVEDVARDVIREEVAPVVREALTDDVLAAIARMTKLTGRVVEVLEEDLHSENEILRQRAALLVAKYTIGHPGVAPRPDDGAGAQQLVVNVGIPRPGDVPAEAVELRACDTCGADKPESEFAADSDRCLACLEARKAEVLARFS